MLELSQEQVTRSSFKSHFLLDKAENSELVKVISRICGLNSQTARAPYISLWSRIKDFKKAQLNRALYEEKLLIKAWLMRGTVHTIPSDEYPIFQKALGPGLARDWSATLEKRGLGLSIKAREKLGKKIVDILAEASLAKNELLPQIKHLLQGFSEREQKIIISRTLRGLSYEGLVCHAEPTGPWYHFKENRFTVVENWFEGRKFRKVDEMDARQNLALAYLAGYGPASVADFAYWTGLKAGEANRTFEEIKDELVEVKIRETKGSYWMLAEDADAIADIDMKREPEVRFLPEFDPLIMGHKNKSRILDEAYRRQVFLRLADVAPVFLVNGRVAGTWNYKFTDQSLDISLFKGLGKQEKNTVERESVRLRKLISRD